MTPERKDQLIDWGVNVFVWCAALSIPALLFTAYVTGDGTWAAWAVVPFILFMAG